MQEKVKYLLIPTLLVVAVDQLTKSLVVAKLDPNDPISLIWTLQLNITRNSGASFSIGSSLTPYRASVAILAVFGITSLALLETDRKSLCFFGIV
ncbi:MAG TPA: signal peptidase II, partial [Acidimicrobiales bacterium]|nr:signal peptidase II [Acidimicrobiales bacterium]